MCKIIVKFHHRNRITQQALYRAFKLVVTELNTKDVRFHYLRHAYAVISLKSGDDVRTAQTAYKPLSSSSADSEESKLQSGEQKETPGFRRILGESIGRGCGIRFHQGVAGPLSSQQGSTGALHLE